MIDCIMDINFIDTDSIEINDTLNLTISYIPETKHKILIIDDFLKNPDDLRNIALQHPFEKTPGRNGNKNPGWISTSNLNYFQIKKTALYLTEKYFNVNYNNEIKIQYNLLDTNINCKYLSIIPHVDHSFFAFQIYLNYPKECFGGTNFYKNKECNLDHNIEYFDADFTKTENYWKLMKYYEKIAKNESEMNKNENYDLKIDSRLVHEDVWEKIGTVEMKYNRFVMYPSYVFHSAYIESGWYDEFKRISLLGFLT